MMFKNASRKSLEMINSFWYLAHHYIPHVVQLYCNFGDCRHLGTILMTNLIYVILLFQTYFHCFINPLCLLEYSYLSNRTSQCQNSGYDDCFININVWEHLLAAAHISCALDQRKKSHQEKSVINAYFLMKC